MSNFFGRISLGKRLFSLGILLCALTPLSGQDIDSNPSTQKRSLSTIADQIRDEPERAAFLELFRQGPAAQMRERAEAFVTRFPQSDFLAQAYEVAARASFDLAKYADGLSYAEKSLALLPENPLLLVSVADVEAHEGHSAAALLHAQQALDDLDRFGSPESIPDKNWPDLRRKLKASANFSKGRVLLRQGLVLAMGDKRTAILRAAKDSLLEANSLNSADLEITYLLGLAQLAVGDSSKSASNFAAVYRAGGDFAPEALDNLQSIYKMLYPSSGVPFQVFLQQVQTKPAQSKEQSSGTSLLQDQEGTSQTGSPLVQSQSAYAGSESCRNCHAQIYQQWSQTGMSKMFRPYAPQNVIGDFRINNQFYLGDEVEDQDGKVEFVRSRDRTLFARTVTRKSRNYFDIRQSDGKWHTYPVDYTIGSKFQQAYATKLPDGQIHVFPIQYNVLHKRWINFWKIIDGPGSERSDPRSWEKLDESTSYQANCAVCHTSQLRNVTGGGFASNNLEFKEPGIDCEMCHGPSLEHVVETTGGQYYLKAPSDPPFNFYQASNRDFVAVCAQCHMQSAIRKPGPAGELNYSSSGAFFGNHVSVPFGEFSRKGFYKDGRFRQTTFIVEALERSQCFKKGQVSCGSCHDPHGHDATSNPTSVKFLDKADLMCTGCHTQFQESARVAEHTHHSAESEGSRCVSCHMPRIMDALLFRARTHQIDDIPSAQMTQRFGQKESPNACILCHSKKNAEWVRQQLASWKPSRPRVEPSGHISVFIEVKEANDY